MIYGHHGFGCGAIEEGSALTRFAKHAAPWECDIFMYGHVHRKQYIEIQRMRPTGKMIESHPTLLMICGTYLKTFNLTDDPSFSEMRGFKPAPIGGYVLNIKPVQKWVKYWVS